MRPQIRGPLERLKSNLCYHAREMRTGIIGLPQVGKTSVFKILKIGRASCRERV